MAKKVFHRGDTVIWEGMEGGRGAPAVIKYIDKNMLTLDWGATTSPIMKSTAQKKLRIIKKHKKGKPYPWDPRWWMK